MDRDAYLVEGADDLVSPALVYYRDIIVANTKRIVEMAGGADRLWPHVKTHKTAELIRMQMEMGISRFKCATVAEAEMTAVEGAAHIILAYPLVGPNINRYLRLAKDFPGTVFYAIGDNFDQLAILAEALCRSGSRMNVLIDVDIGMHRTGASLDSLEALYGRCAALDGLVMKGLHCYDGHRHEHELDARKSAAYDGDKKVLEIQGALRQKGLECEILVMGGSPSFPCRTGNSGFFLSPGTIFVGDWGYYSNYPDLAFTPGAALFCRVVSHPSGRSFTLDLGSKGIATDPAGDRGVIAGLPEARPLFQSEEHWVFSLPEGKDLPPIGSVQYVIPTHVCPTSALYSEVVAVSGGKIDGRWAVKARNRQINY